MLVVVAALLAGCGGSGSKRIASDSTIGPGGPPTSADLGTLPPLPPGPTDLGTSTTARTHPTTSTTVRATATSTSVVAGSSGVKGTVTSSPTCPVEQPNNPCPPAPTQAALKLVDGSGRVVATGQSGTDGRFSMAAPPGSYTLQATPSSTGPGRGCQPDPVTIAPGRYTDTSVSCDTGIR